MWDLPSLVQTSGGMSLNHWIAHTHTQKEMNTARCVCMQAQQYVPHHAKLSQTTSHTHHSPSSTSISLYLFLSLSFGKMILLSLAVLHCQHICYIIHTSTHTQNIMKTIAVIRVLLFRIVCNHCYCCYCHCHGCSGIGAILQILFTFSSRPQVPPTPSSMEIHKRNNYTMSSKWGVFGE